MAERLETTLGARVGLSEFGSWMASEQKRVFLLCVRMLRDPEEADCATQDTFLKAWQYLKANQAREIDDFTRWVTRIAVNTCLDRLRSRRWQFWKRRPNPEDETIILNQTVSPRPDAERQLMATQIERRLSSAMGRLSDRQRSVFTLRHYEDLSLAEIGEILSLDVGTVKAHLSRALGKLREELKDLYFRDNHEQGGA
ncbi:MAG: RNA polymerase sigma factor [Acidobacteriaceae bacterium]|nr:RNA polymerase sigma factor [Acidobacteriaceae bacterium]